MSHFITALRKDSYLETISQAAGISVCLDFGSDCFIRFHVPTVWAQWIKKLRQNGQLVRTWDVTKRERNMNTAIISCHCTIFWS
jgi:hypothetical protein